MRVNFHVARLPDGKVRVFGDWREMHQYYVGANLDYEKAVEDASYRMITAQNKNQFLAQLNSALAQLGDRETES